MGRWGAVSRSGTGSLPAHPCNCHRDTRGADHGSTPGPDPTLSPPPNPALALLARPTPRHCSLPACKPISCPLPAGVPGCSPWRSHPLTLSDVPSNGCGVDGINWQPPAPTPRDINSRERGPRPSQHPPHMLPTLLPWPSSPNNCPSLDQSFSQQSFIKETYTD